MPTGTCSPNPSFAAAHCGFADSLTYLGRFDEAIASFEKTIGLSTNDPQRWAFYTYGADIDPEEGFRARLGMDRARQRETEHGRNYA